VKTEAEFEREYIATLPLFVSVPRSGCNWLQAVLELYFNRHRVLKHQHTPTWLEGEAVNPMWMHVHDNFNDRLDVSTPFPAVYLYRSPVDVIYSLCKLHGGEGTVSIEDKCRRYVRSRMKWMNPDNGKVLPVRYELALKDTVGTIRQVHEFWKDYHDVGDFDEARAKWATDTVGDKRSVNDKNGDNLAFKNPESGTESYETDRQRFEAQWGQFILDRT
jgi:hypothetical protein